MRLQLLDGAENNGNISLRGISPHHITKHINAQNVDIVKREWRRPGAEGDGLVAGCEDEVEMVWGVGAAPFN